MHKRNGHARREGVAIHRPRKVRGLAEDDTVFGAIAVGVGEGLDARADVGAVHPLDAPPPPSPSAAPWPQLLPIGWLAGKPAFRFTRPVALVGRRAAAHVHLSAPEISNAHAIMLDDGGRVYLRDLASRGGVRLNCMRVREAYLEDGDHVAFGRFIFQFQAATRCARPLVEEVAPAAAQLEADGAAQPVPVEGPVTVIGRRSGCDVVLREASCSTVHAVIFSMAGKRFVRDLGSRTGTFVNGQGVKQEELHVGDVILIGETELRYTAAAGAAVTPGTPGTPGRLAETVTEAAVVGVGEPELDVEPPPAGVAESMPAVVAEPGVMLSLAGSQECDEEVLAGLMGALAAMPEPVAAPEAVAEALAEVRGASAAERGDVEQSDEARSSFTVADHAEPVGSMLFEGPHDGVAAALADGADGDAGAMSSAADGLVACDEQVEIDRGATAPGREEASVEHSDQEVPAARAGERDDARPSVSRDGRARANGRSGGWFSFVKRAGPEQPAPPAPGGDGGGDGAADEELPVWELSEQVSSDGDAEREDRLDPEQAADSTPTHEGLISDGAAVQWSTSGEARGNGGDEAGGGGGSLDFDGGEVGGDHDERPSEEGADRTRGLP